MRNPKLGGPRLILAPDKFKATLTAAEAAAAMAAGARRALPTAELVQLPVADGGDGTVAAAICAGAQARQVSVRDALGRPVSARYAVLGDTAIVESAQACGLDRVPVTPDSALGSHSAGVGDLIAAALADGCRELVIGLGGSACTDGGAGMARALGVRMTDGAGRELPYGGGALTELAAIDIAGLEPRLRQCTVRIACDVTNPLLGAAGAAAVFGPQKGAGPAEVRRLAAGLVNYAEQVRQACGIDIGRLPGGGAAGGLAAGLVAFAGGQIGSGSDYLLRLLGFAELLAGSALVLTGEGCLDEQSLAGKAPAGVARLAGRHGVPVLAVAGRVRLTPAALAGAGFAAAYSLTDLLGADRAERDAANALAEVTEQAVRQWDNRVLGAAAGRSAG
ncbi:MAG: glycerate kinase [Jatrophihabitantaceae bacterium]